ncbi:MAG TPA: hemerythrin domain-containing protein [Bacteroidia bacterium]|jgi:hemerythrin-like domain-containing protein|nr:hemerythrin domain-containing protein [Bacteroidia bacterium]
MSEERNMNRESDTGRRQFLGNSAKLALLSGVAGLGFWTGCKDDGNKEVSPPEDLMQEHGILNRIILIYDTCRINLINKITFHEEGLLDAASITRKFIEEYHERQEEQYIFPRFEKANQQTELVAVLRRQHDVGRMLTSTVLHLGKSGNRTESEQEKLIQALASFSSMFRPHEAREDTVLFPAFRKIVSGHEYDSLGEEFEKNEHRLFGQDGFAHVVDRISGIEQSLGIYDLDQFTPSGKMDGI